MTRIYRYVLRSDTGMAPHPKGGLITLATCKPEIRRMARPGDWVVGNLPSPKNEFIAWAGKIESSLPLHDYSARYGKRSDALLELAPDGNLRRIPGKLEWYHQDSHQQSKDRKGNALVFDMTSSWCFGDSPRPLADDLRHLAAQGQGYRVNGRKPDDLNRLEAWLREQGAPGIHGEPRDGWPDGPDGSGKGCAKTPPQRKPRQRC